MKTGFSADRVWYFVPGILKVNQHIQSSLYFEQMADIFARTRRCSKEGSFVVESIVQRGWRPNHRHQGSKFHENFCTVCHQGSKFHENFCTFCNLLISPFKARWIP